MIRRSLLQYAAIAVFAMAFAAGPAVAAPDWLGFHPSTEARAWLSPVWDFLSSLLSGGETVQPGEGLDNRCTIDPNGQPRCVETGSPGGSLDTRCTIDPDGHTVCVETDPPNG